MEDQPITRADVNVISALIATLGRQMESLSTRMDDLSNGKRLGRKSFWGKKLLCSDEKMTSERVRSNQGNQQVNYDFGMINDIPLFYGGGEEFIDWEIDVDRFFGMNDVPEDKQAKKVAKKLKLTASLWWDRLVVQRRRENKASIRTWRKMKQYMRDRFLPKDYEKIMRRREKLDRDKVIKSRGDEDWKGLTANLSIYTSSSNVEFVVSSKEEEIFQMDDHTSNFEDVALEKELCDIHRDYEDLKSSCGVFEYDIEEIVPLKDNDEVMKIQSSEHVKDGLADFEEKPRLEEYFINMADFFEKIPEFIVPELEVLYMLMIMHWKKLFKSVLHVAYTSTEFVMEFEALDGEGENSGRVLLK